ncbi:hypothetical protein CVT27_13780 [Streptomyces cavourensis]|nr:hypothetical protein CVT27_13780 [Streptomyces cavourensis]
MRSHAPDTAAPALRADDATFDTRPSRTTFSPSAPPPSPSGVRGRNRARGWASPSRARVGRGTSACPAFEDGTLYAGGRRPHGLG